MRLITALEASATQTVIGDLRRELGIARYPPRNTMVETHGICCWEIYSGRHHSSSSSSVEINGPVYRSVPHKIKSVRKVPCANSNAWAFWSFNPYSYFILIHVLTKVFVAQNYFFFFFFLFFFFFFFSLSFFFFCYFFKFFLFLFCSCFALALLLLCNSIYLIFIF